jgi:UDP-N-acetyl-2-amino-2-deoxyglucuronate dehydrogenase
VAEPPDQPTTILSKSCNAVTRASRHRIAVIGLGMAVAPHARSLRDLAGRVDVVAAFSPTKARRDAFAAQFDFPVTNDMDAIVDDASIDCVLILTPPRTHLALVSRFAAAGKNILLEKPLEADTRRAEALVDVCARHGVTLGVVLQHRFRPGARALAACIAGEGLGQIAAASVAVPWWRPQSYYDEPGRGTVERDGGGVLLTQAIHTLDLFLSLVPPLAEVAAYARTTPLHRMETEDLACAALRFANGALGTLDGKPSGVRRAHRHRRHARHGNTRRRKPRNAFSRWACRHGGRTRGLRGRRRSDGVHP